MTVKLDFADVAEARAVWHAICTSVELMDQVGEIPPHAPLYGQRDRLVAVARRLDHEINRSDRPAERRCARDSDWCDGVICRQLGVECPNAEPAR